MVQASEKQHYEAAAFHRDRIGMLRDLTQRQKAIQGGKDDVDVFAYYREGPRVALQLFTLRAGKMIGKREFYWEDLGFFQPAQFLRDALQQYYLTAGFIPRQIYLSVAIEDQELMSQWLAQKLQEQGKGRRVRILAPQRGKKHDLVLLVEKTPKLPSRYVLRSSNLKGRSSWKIYRWPWISLRFPSGSKPLMSPNIQGAEGVAALVVCEEGVMKRSQYRKFKIKTVQGSDDCRSIYEVVHRRYRRRLADQASLPDLILIDGGKGQLHSAYQALSKLGIEDVPLASIAKREEVLFVQGQEGSLVLPRTSPVLHLIQKIRDEAHRFAVTYHRKRRSLRDFHSELDQIVGIGEKRKSGFCAILGVWPRSAAPA